MSQPASRRICRIEDFVGVEAFCLPNPPKDIRYFGWFLHQSLTVIYRDLIRSADSLALGGAVRLYLAGSDWNLKKGRAADHCFRNLLSYRDLALRDMKFGRDKRNWQELDTKFWHVAPKWAADNKKSARR